jgi:hypothetical protein
MPVPEIWVQSTQKPRIPLSCFHQRNGPLTTAWRKGLTSQENACCNAAWLSKIYVLGANAVKFKCMTFVLLTYLEPVLATIGDGIATFLRRPHPFTVDRPFLILQQAQRFAGKSKRIRVGGKVRYHQPRIALRWWNTPS